MKKYKMIAYIIGKMLYEMTPFATLAMAGFMCIPMFIAAGMTADIAKCIWYGNNIVATLNETTHGTMNWWLYGLFLVWTISAIVGIFRLDSSEPSYALGECSER